MRTIPLRHLLPVWKDGKQAVRDIKRDLSITRQTSSDELKRGPSRLQSSGVREATAEIEQDSNTRLSEEELRARKTAGIQNWLASRFGREKIALVKILQQHNVVVRGTNEDGMKLLEALLDWKQKEL